MGSRNQFVFAIAVLSGIVIFGVSLAIVAAYLLTVAFDAGPELDRLVDYLSLTLAAVPILYWVIKRIKARIDTDDGD